MHRENTFARFTTVISVLCLMLSAGAGGALADEPELPAGLFSDQSPSVTAAEPGLPSGLGEADKDTASRLDTGVDTESAPTDLEGFADVRLGIRTSKDPDQADAVLRETRLQMSFQKDKEAAAYRVTADLIYDGVAENYKVDLDEGTGWIDIREASVLLQAASWADIKAGRQILTWGTGDLIFINDLFPKDWNSFFTGRDVEYLKAPSDAVKVSIFGSAANLDIVYTPAFDPDRFIDGRRISYYNSSQGAVVGRSTPVQVSRPDDIFEDDEIALRLYRNLGSWETALYGYEGFWKSPNGSDQTTGLFIFPRLTVLGASFRGPAAGGIGQAEIGFYNSRDDGDGSDPFIRNSEWRILVGFEKELLPELTGSFQYYLEQMSDHDAYLLALPSGSPAKDENRHVITLRLTRLLMNQNLTLSLFNFYSPSDEDGYLRANSTYKVTDSWQVDGGGNLFYGKKDHTFFGQFRDASNVYAGLRYSF